MMHFDNRISLGNVLTIIGGIIAAGVGLSNIEKRDVAQDGRIDRIEQRVDFVDQRVSEQGKSSREALAEIRASQTRIEDKLSDIREQIAGKADRAK